MISTFILTIILNQNQFALYLNRSIVHVHSPTHQTGHILDLVVSHSDDNFITSVTVHPNSLSDHHRIELTLSALKPAVKTVMIAKRNFRNIEIDALRNVIKSVCADMTLFAGTNARQAEELVAMYKNTPHPWYDSDIDDAREKKRKLENVWRITGNSSAIICQCP